MARALRERGFVPRRSLWEVDHIIPLVDGGSHDMTNLQSLCTPCHKRKTAAEATARALRSKPPPEEKPADSFPAEIMDAAHIKPPDLDQDATLDPLLRRAEALNHRIEGWLSHGPNSTRSSDEA
ncbi:HNH endonuclease [Myxococcota bacterium]|nr:HNH endonuclease [Myxococcota bacterium]